MSAEPMPPTRPNAELYESLLMLLAWQGECWDAPRFSGLKPERRRRRAFDAVQVALLASGEIRLAGGALKARFGRPL